MDSEADEVPTLRTTAISWSLKKLHFIALLNGSERVFLSAVRRRNQQVLEENKPVEHYLIKNSTLHDFRHQVFLVPLTCLP